MSWQVSCFTHCNALMADEDVSMGNLCQTSKSDEMVVVMRSYEMTSQCVKRRRGHHCLVTASPVSYTGKSSNWGKNIIELKHE